MWLAASSIAVPDGLPATRAAAQLNPKPHQGLSSKNPASHAALDPRNSTAAMGLRAGSAPNSVRQSERARYYGAALGRFTSLDAPFNDQQPQDPQSWNLYSYVRNNPLKNIDPFGEDCITTSNQTSSGVSVTTERGGSAQTCSGTYVEGTVNTNSYQYNGTNLTYSFANDTASGAGNIQFSRSLDSDALSPGVANMLRDAGNRAAPFVNAAGEGLKLFGYLVAPPFMAAAECAAKGKDCIATVIRLPISF